MREAGSPLRTHKARTLSHLIRREWAAPPPPLAYATTHLNSKSRCPVAEAQPPSPVHRVPTPFPSLVKFPHMDARWQASKRLAFEAVKCEYSLRLAYTPPYWGIRSSRQARGAARSPLVVIDERQDPDTAVWLNFTALLSLVLFSKLRASMSHN